MKYFVRAEHDFELVDFFEFLRAGGLHMLCLPASRIVSQEYT